MNLTGNWKGKYTYEKGYPYSVIGTSEPFTLTIIDNNGVISGSCIDNIVKSIEGNESYIVGTFKNDSINFKKRYKIHTAIDENGNVILEHDAKFDGVDYTGRLHKKIFSKSFYFIGKWNITATIKEDTGQIQIFNFSGSWEMELSK